MYRDFIPEGEETEGGVNILADFIPEKKPKVEIVVEEKVVEVEEDKPLKKDSK